MRPLPLHPQRRPLARPTTRQEKGASRGFSKVGREEAGSAEGLDDQVLDLLGLGEQVGRVRRVLPLGHPDHDPVVAPDRLDLGLARPAQLRFQGQGPGSVDPPSPGSEETQPPVPHLVPGALEDDRAVVGDGPGGLPLLVEVRDEVLGGLRVEVVLPAQALDRLFPRRRRQLASEPRRWPVPARRGRPPRSALQNGILPGSPGAGTTSTRSRVISVMRQLDAPRTKTSPTRDSKTISSSSSPTRRSGAVTVGEKDAVETTVGDGAGVGHGQALRALASPHGAPETVPDDPWPQLGELVGGVAPGEHVEDALEADARGSEAKGAARRTRAKRSSTRAFGQGHRWPPAAGRGRRGGCGDSGSPRLPPSSWPSSPRHWRGGRPGTWGR